MSLRGMLCSDGKASARVFTVLALPAAGPKPRDELTRVLFTPPPDVPRRAAPVQSSGPRQPDQVRRQEPRPGIEFPDNRSALSTQRFIVDPVWAAVELRRMFAEEP
ncbi:hypothetical protein A7982_12299 [Minicystis rosea]|nr:Hypothetical protein A7982_11475 [Minicystis rosea]APR86950.1 hypothetical protein A7982_12299 [Minicystis rosea]